MSSRRYYFELLHKQDDRGSDHVEVGVSKCPPPMPVPGLFLCVFKCFILEQTHSFLLPWLPVETSQCHCFPGYSSTGVHGVLLSFPAGGFWAAEDPALRLPWARRAQSRQVPPCWLHPSSEREVAKAMEPFPVLFFFPFGITMSFESELACLGSTALAKPGACVRSSGWLRGRCWLVSKGFLSPKNSLITGVKVVPAKHQGGRQHPFLAGCLPPPHPLHPDKICISSGKKQIVGGKKLDGGDVSEMGCFCWREGAKPFSPCRKTSQLCRDRQQQHPQQKQDPRVSLPGGIEGLVPTMAPDGLLKSWS